MGWPWRATGQDLGDEDLVPGIEDEEERAREAAARGHEFDSAEDLLGASSCDCGGCELVMRCCGDGVSANPFLIHCACDASQVHQAMRRRPAASGEKPEPPTPTRPDDLKGDWLWVSALDLWLLKYEEDQIFAS